MTVMITRSEDWTINDQGMVSTAVVDVFEGEVVHINDALMDEFGFPREKEVVDGFARPRFVWEVPYDKFKTAMGDKGYVHSS